MTGSGDDSAAVDGDGGPRLWALADGGVLVDGVDGPAVAAALAAADLSGVEDVVATTAAVTLIVDPDAADVRWLSAHVAGLLGPLVAGTAAHPPAGDAADASVVTVPVAFDGPDLAEVAGRLAATEAAVVELLLGATLTVAFLGFSPGFAYLTGLPPVLATLARRPVPRRRVPAGAVAVAGGFAAIYPQASPGGWNLLGSTDLPLFDRHRPPYARLRPGQQVRLVAADGPRRPAPTPARRALRATGPRAVLVEEPGPATTVQDGGRVGLAALGVPRAGPADPLAHRLANRLVGNEDAAPALEVTMRGPRLRFDCDTFVAVVGDAPASLDGRAVPGSSPVPVTAGQVLTLGVCRSGARAVLAVSGGVLGPVEVGSRSSDLLCGLGPGPLRAGDRLGLGVRGRPAGHLASAALSAGPLAPWARCVGLAGSGAARGRPVAEPLVLRVVPGPDAPGGVPWDPLTEWVVQPDSDRVGVRFHAAAAPARGRPGALVGGSSHGVADEHAGRLPGTSRGVVTGVVQLPPGGDPVVLLCDHATVGGYPLVGTVPSIDAAVLAQLRPGDRCRLVPGDVAGAVADRRRAAAALAAAVAGRYPTSTA